MAKCCHCDCPYCGTGEPNESQIIKVFICSASDCYFQSQDIQEVYDHRDTKHLQNLQIDPFCDNDIVKESPIPSGKMKRRWFKAFSS